MLTEDSMQTKLSILGAVLMTALLGAGCAGPEQKLGRGMSNSYEIVRGAEMQRSVEQSAVFERGSVTYATGLVQGFTRTMARTGLGLYEIVTFPIPNHSHADYGPIATSYLSPKPAYPDSYKPGLFDGSTFATDTRIGFSGGDIAPMIPGSKFRVFDN
jgi:putative exosortase-associated protein (TIGR04073 family)